MSYCACFGGSPSGKAAKIGSSKKINFLYSSVKPTNITDKYKGYIRWLAIKYRGHVSAGGTAPMPHIFVG
jgi:hypothetical protein